MPGEAAKLGCWPFFCSRTSAQTVMKFLWLYILFWFRLTFNALFLLYWLFQRKEITSKYLYHSEMKACFCNLLLRLSIQNEATSHLIQMRQSQLHFKKAPLVSQTITQIPVKAALKMSNMDHREDKGFFKVKCRQSPKCLPFQN